jgi:ElaB/YqjD/DUF883 family membrane-anchored ribosome-binding protein
MQTQRFDDLGGDAGAAGSGPSTMRDNTQEKMDRAAQTAHDTVDRVHRRTMELTDRATTEGERYYQQACSWISEHPMQAVLGAVFVGYLYGRIRS